MVPQKAVLILSDQGFHWDELVSAFHAFKEAGCQVEIGSPHGHPKADPRTLRASWALHSVGLGTTRSRLPANEWWGKPVVEAITRAKPLKAQSFEGVDVIFVVGWERPDLQANAELDLIFAEALKSGRWLAAEWHLIREYPAFAALAAAANFWLELKIGLGFAARAARPRFEKVLVFGSARRGAHAVRKLLRVIREDLAPATQSHVAEFLDRKAGPTAGRS